MLYVNLKKRLNRRLKFRKLQKNNKESYPLYQSLINKKINIFDIGAGQRMLPEIINFNGISKVFLVDPNDNIQYSYDQLTRYFSDKKNIFKYQYGISDKTKKLKYFKSPKATISTFAFNDKKLKVDSRYYNNKNAYMQVYNFSDFLKKFKLPKPDIIKIDVEGLEGQVLSSVLKTSNPLIVQIETNINNSMFHESFSKINNLLLNKNYFLYTLFPSYGGSDLTKTFDINLKDIELNLIKNHIVQSECYYIKRKKYYTVKDLVCLNAYGFQEYFKKILNTSKNKLTKNEKKIFKKLEIINN